MGQAKARGTQADRIALAIVRQEEQRKEERRIKAEYEASLTPKQIQERKSKERSSAEMIALLATFAAHRGMQLLGARHRF